MIIMLELSIIFDVTTSSHPLLIRLVQWQSIKASFLEFFALLKKYVKHILISEFKSGEDFRPSCLITALVLRAAGGWLGLSL